jgi:hypothetical protein
MTKIGTVTPISRSDFSRLMPSSPGILMSSSATSGALRTMALSAWEALEAICTV